MNSDRSVGKDCNACSVSGEGQPSRRNVCNCYQITYEQMQRIVDETNGASFETLRENYQVGSRCTSCEYEIKDMVRVWQEEHARGMVGMAGVQIPLGRRIGASWRGIKTAIRHHFTLRRFAIFMIRRNDISTSLALSNLAFPEDRSNVNGKQVEFMVTLFDVDGRKLARRTGLVLRDGCSVELSLEDLFPDVRGDVTGMMIIDYRLLRQVGSLRPYCVFNFSHGVPARRGRWHYHDKYAAHDYNGHYHCNHPFQPKQECWMAISNPLASSYSSAVHLRLADGTTISRTVDVPPLGSMWVELRSFFGLQRPSEWSDPNALIWFENKKRLMVWFAWKQLSDGRWIVQHH